MPELPEVETIRRSLEPLIEGQKIISASINYPNLLKNALVEEFKNELKNQVLQSIGRRGKYLIFNFESKLKMIVHLRMTGQLRYEKKGSKILKHTHIIIKLNSDYELRYVDVRKFGMIYIGTYDEVVNQSGWHKLGPEPLSNEFSFNYFDKILKKYSNKRIKALLLDQHAIAGIGNIYADEMLFRSKIHPLSLSGCIPIDVAKKLYEEMKEVLTLGIENHGTTLNDYVDGFGNTGSFQFSLKAYGREDLPCEYCLREISKIKVAGRSSHICNNCQIRYC
ncbi:MAG: bifunctional DNA-formamidopyrimidine glycosylase/DNA-(apurinic or apyrimidinic site) lyase [Clostridia bacterium]